MDRATGTVRSLLAHAAGPRAIVDVEISAACARCAAGKGCGAGLLAGPGKIRQVEASIDPQTRVDVGDRVGISLRPADLMHAAIVVYVPPLLGAVIAAGLAALFSGSDVDAATAALIGLAIGVSASRYYINRVSCLERYVPVIDRVLPVKATAS